MSNVLSTVEIIFLILFFAGLFAAVVSATSVSKAGIIISFAVSAISLIVLSCNGFWVKACGDGVDNNNRGKEYPALMVVSEVDKDEDAVYCLDFNGGEWSFTGAESWAVGDYCSMIMNDMGTESNYDDVIVSTRYTGFLNGNWGCDKYGNPVMFSEP